MLWSPPGLGWGRQPAGVRAGNRPAQGRQVVKLRLAASELNELTWLCSRARCQPCALVAQGYRVRATARCRQPRRGALGRNVASYRAAHSYLADDPLRS